MLPHSCSVMVTYTPIFLSVDLGGARAQRTCFVDNPSLSNPPNGPRGCCIFFSEKVRDALSRYLSMGVDQPLSLGAHLNGDESPW